MVTVPNGRNRNNVFGGLLFPFDTVQYRVVFRELCPSLRVTTSYTFPVQTGGIFYFPWHRHQIKGTEGFYIISEIVKLGGSGFCISARLLVSPPKAG